MAEFLQNSLVFLFIAIVWAILWNSLIKRIPIAILISAISSAVSFQIYDAILFDRTIFIYLINFITTFAMGFGIALLISIPFRVWRGKPTGPDDSKS